MIKKKQKELTPEQIEEIRTKDFFDMILPGTVKFFSDHYILGDSYRCVWAIREYPPTTEEQAILSQLGDRSGVTLRIYHRLVESMEQRKIIQNATRRNKLKSGGNDVNETIEAEGNFWDLLWSECDADKLEITGIETLPKEFDEQIKIMKNILERFKNNCKKYDEFFEYTVS